MKRGLVLLIAVLLLTSCGHGSLMSSESIVAEKNEKTWQEEYDLGIRYLSEGKYEEAIIAFTTAIKIDSKQAPAYVGRGDAYVLSGETEENLSAAQDDYEKAIELDETDPNAYLGLADVYIRRGEYDTALELLHSALLKTGNDQRIAEKIAEMEDGAFADSQGKMRRQNYFEPNGSLSYYSLSQYDSEGNVSRLDSYLADGTYEGYTIYYRVDDDSFQYQYSDDYDANGGKKGTGLWVGDKDGKWLYSTTINEDGTEATARSVAQYDENGTCIGWDSLNENGTVQSYVRYEGDKLVYYDANGAVSMYSEDEEGE